MKSNFIRIEDGSYVNLDYILRIYIDRECYSNCPEEYYVNFSVEYGDDVLIKEYSIHSNRNDAEKSLDELFDRRLLGKI
jgi:hypothetical protein